MSEKTFGDRLFDLAGGVLEVGGQVALERERNKTKPSTEDQQPPPPVPSVGVTAAPVQSIDYDKLLKGAALLLVGLVVYDKWIKPAL